MAIEYQNVRSERGVLHISEISRETRHDHGALSCFGCGGKMVAALGEKNAHHFKHDKRSDAESCSWESYLHWMTKTKVHEILSLRAAQKKSVHIHLGSDTTIWTDLEGRAVRREVLPIHEEICALASEVRSEKGDIGLIPDVSLHYQDGPPVWVEIAVSHYCEPEKIAAGRRIVEISVQDEGDAEWLFSQLENGLISHESDRVQTYNFRIPATHRLLDEKQARERISDHLKTIASLTKDLDARNERIRVLMEEIQKKAEQITAERKKAEEEREKAETATLAADREQKAYHMIGRLFEDGRIEVKRLPDTPKSEVPPPSVVSQTIIRIYADDLSITGRFALSTYAVHHGLTGGKDVKSCLLCVHQGFAPLSSVKGAKGMICGKDNSFTPCEQAEAVSCPSFQKVADLKALREIRDHLMSISPDDRSVPTV